MLLSKNLLSTKGTPSRVVVLGSSGFIGKSFIQRFENTYSFLSFNSQELNLISPESVDILSSQLMDGDTIVMFSALTPDKGKDGNTLIKNVHMANHVAMAMEKSSKKIDHYVYISSDAVYDNGPQIHEGTPVFTGDLYSCMHLTREILLKSACDKLKIPYLSLRLSSVFGKGDTHNGYGPNRFLNQAKKNETITLFGHGEEQRDHVYINDVTNLLGLILNYKTVGILNVASGISTSFFDVAKTIITKTGSESVLSPTERKNAVTHRHYDNSLIYQLFAHFKFTKLDEAVNEILKN